MSIFFRKWSIMKNPKLSRRSLLGIAAANAAVSAEAVLGACKGPGETPLLDEFDGVKADSQLQWMMKKIYTSPLELSEELRRARPIVIVGDVLFVSRYTDVIEVLGLPNIFSVRLYKEKMGDFMLTHDETATHRRDKGVMSSVMPLTDGDKVMSLCNKIAVDAITGEGPEIEVVSKLGRAVPVRVVQTYFGLDGNVEESLLEWSYWSQFDNFHNHHFHQRENSKEVSKRAGQAKQELALYATEVVKRCAIDLSEGKERDDIVARLVRTKFPESVGFDISRVVLNTMGLLIGAVETSSHAIVHIIDELLNRPDVLRQATSAAAKDDIDLVTAIAWEAVRFQPISPIMFRFCETDFALAKGTDREIHVKAGTTVIPITQSAEFDEVEVEAPGEFRLRRPDYQSFLFGHGNHRCLGEYVGKRIISSAIMALLKRGPLRRAAGAKGEISYGDGPFPESLVIVAGGKS